MNDSSEITLDDMIRSAGAASDFLRAIAHPQRLLILCQLSRGERPVGELAGLLGMRQSTLSQHLARLRRDGLVKTRRESQNIYYALVGDSAVRLIETLAGLYCPVEVADPAEEGAA